MLISCREVGAEMKGCNGQNTVRRACAGKGMCWAGGNPLAAPQDSERFLATPDAGQLQR